MKEAVYQGGLGYSILEIITIDDSKLGVSLQVGLDLLVPFPTILTITIVFVRNGDPLRSVDRFDQTFGPRDVPKLISNLGGE